MDFQEHQLDDLLTVQAYAEGYLEIGGQRYDSAVILGDTVMPLPEVSVRDLTVDSFARAEQAGVQLIVIGTGSQQQFIDPKLMVALAQRGIGVECMTTASACRTLAMLQSEGRKVWAWLWL